MEFCDDEDLPYGAPGPPPPPPSHRDGLNVGDEIDLTPRYMAGGPCPVRITGFTCLPNDIVVEWLGLQPLGALSASGRSTIDRRHVAIAVSRIATTV